MYKISTYMNGFFSMSSDFPIDTNQSFENVQSVKNDRSLRGLFLVGLTGMYVYYVYISLQYLQCSVFFFINLTGYPPI